MATFTVNPALRSTSATIFFPSSGVVIPANAHTANVVFTMPNSTERANSSQHLDFGIELLVAPSTSWKAYLTAGWNGGTGQLGKNSTVVNPPPTATLGGDFFGAYAGQLARISVKVSEPLTLGGTITVL